MKHFKLKNTSINILFIEYLFDSFQFTTIVNFQIVGSYFLCFWELFC